MLYFANAPVITMPVFLPGLGPDPFGRAGASFYFKFPNASLILTHALSILGMLLAKEKRTHLGSPKASPITEDTWAVFNKYIEKSSALLIFVPRNVCPKYEETSGKT